MKINNPAGSAQYQSYVQSLKNAEASTAKGQGEMRVPISDAANTDKVTFSEDASARAGVSRLGTTISAEVDVLEEGRLAQLQKQVQEGTYQVETNALADAILGKDE